MDLLNAEGTERLSSLIDPVAEHIGEKDSGFGSTANITDYVLTECRLLEVTGLESFKIGDAVDNLFVKKQGNHLPDIPIGGATDDPRVHADWDAFEKWVHHQGPRPIYNGDSSLPTTPTTNPAATSDSALQDANAAYRRADYATAMRLFRPFADQGNAVAQTDVGGMYEAGQGVPRDYAEAAKWYRKAADQGYDVAQTNLAGMYQNGKGVPQDYAEATRWYHKAENQGYANAQGNLGFMYENGQGVERNYAQALTLYRKAAAQGNAVAQNNIGAMYINGHGVARDFTEAMNWYRKAADQGLVIAQNNLGGMYYLGQGVARNYAEAAKWYRMAAGQGNAQAKKNLAELYARFPALRGQQDNTASAAQNGSPWPAVQSQAAPSPTVGRGLSPQELERQRDACLNAARVKLNRGADGLVASPAIFEKEQRRCMELYTSRLMAGSMKGTYADCSLKLDWILRYRMMAPGTAFMAEDRYAEYCPAK
jgi:TPR repeat protein